MPDELHRELLRRFVQGDRDAFESLFGQFQVEVYHWILRIVRDASAAEDCRTHALKPPLPESRTAVEARRVVLAGDAHGIEAQGRACSTNPIHWEQRPSET